jgi:hypothetical protein
MRMQLKIRTEEDYLQAHLTAIKGRSRGTSPTPHLVKQRVTSALKKWILGKAAMLPEGRNFGMVTFSETIATGDHSARRKEFPRECVEVLECWNLRARHAVCIRRQKNYRRSEFR